MGQVDAVTALSCEWQTILFVWAACVSVCLVFMRVKEKKMGHFMQEPKTKPKYVKSNVPNTSRLTFFLKTARKKKEPKQTFNFIQTEQQPALFGCQASKRLLVRTRDVSLFQSCLTSCPQDLLSGCDENFPSTIKTIAKHRMERERELP